MNGSQKQQLVTIARNAMLANGFEPDMPSAALAQANAARPDGAPGPAVRDLRDLPWSSIDNDDSRDLDQIEVCVSDNGVTRVLIGIADVDALVPSGSPADDHARANTTSIYTPAVIFPMLPLQLSTDRTSLNEDQDRRALIADMIIAADGTVSSSDIYRALVRNQAQLTYNALAAWLDGSGPAPAAIRRVPGLDAQLRLQDQIAATMQAEREVQGALDFDRSELRPVVDDDGVKDLQTDTSNRAKLLIENFMIAGNGSAVRFLNSKGFPSVRRVVRSPERWARIVDLAEQHGGKLPPDPDAPALQQFLKDQRAKAPATFPDLSVAIIKLLGRGEYVAIGANEPSAHFALAAHEYSHTTAPNRRYADVLMQRLIKGAIAGMPPPYSLAQLSALAQRCTDREDAANKVERLTKKAAAALWLGDRIGQKFDAIVTGAGPKGTWVRLTGMPVEGRLDRGAEGLDVGDRVRVQLVSTDPPRGFIDFARTS
ncbi:MAG TPA: RNB domain-containing ribonuclease [Vicinamibacterales bacterium]|nr:RNB domain-containing ribonuclease [Vicinamibacterales bacterium]